MMIWPKQARFLCIFGLIILIIGVLPLILEYKVLELPDFIPLSGLAYQAIIIVLGILAIFLGKPSKFKGY